ncbi:unnamed protein product [Gongylonema pulchrum]|uniref:Crp/Fnr family transcriptional regulator n=1 Tax=Gongylonema pulchrum TaxID=637853 RepID=A0A183EAD7_9BILA|nr:unnamed protein product [Gongylonema pulchrum]
MVLWPSDALPYHLCQHYFATPLTGILPEALGSAALRLDNVAVGVIGERIGRGQRMFGDRRVVFACSEELLLLLSDGEVKGTTLRGSMAACSSAMNNLNFLREQPLLNWLDYFVDRARLSALLRTETAGKRAT